MSNTSESTEAKVAASQQPPETKSPGVEHKKRPMRFGSSGDSAIVVTSLVRKGLMDDPEDDPNAEKRGYYVENGAERKVTVAGGGVEIGYVPGDPAVVIKPYFVDGRGTRRIGVVEFIPPEIVDEFVRLVLEARDEAAKHKDETLTVVEGPPVDHEDIADAFDDDELPQEEILIATNYVTRVCADHKNIELTAYVDNGAGKDIPAAPPVAVKPEQIHGLRAILKAAYDDPNRGRATLLYATRHFETEMPVDQAVRDSQLGNEAIPPNK